MNEETKPQQFIGGRFQGLVSSVPFDCNKVSLGTGGQPETYTRRKIKMLSIYREVFAAETMSDKEVLQALRGKEIAE